MSAMHVWLCLLPVLLGAVVQGSTLPPHLRHLAQSTTSAAAAAVQNQSNLTTATPSTANASAQATSSSITALPPVTQCITFEVSGRLPQGSWPAC